MKQKLFLFNIVFFLILPITLKGEVVVFTKQDSADWTLPENQDRIADSVWITRKHNQSIFNIALESGMTNISPLNTLWSRNSIINTEMSDFTTFRSMNDNEPQGLIGDTISLYLPDYGMFFNVIFSSFSGGNSGGGFSYSREEVFPTHLETLKQNIIFTKFKLNQNYPNPFNPVTNFSYDLPEDSFVNLTVYDMLGNVVNNLVNKNQGFGPKSIQWDATNNQGQPVSAGVYLYSIEAGDFRQTKKMILLK
tara:strand:- start:2046 stop:2795 length:750 start_codon:yes stop_codon:yes gene_type:complete